MSRSRENEILRFLSKKSPATVEELADLLQVSEATVRRDLVLLENQGLVLKRRGEISLPGLGVEPMFNQRLNQNAGPKQRIAQYAADQIEEGEVIALDVGTTTAALAKELLKRKGLTIFTYSLQIASVLSRSQHNIYVIGGGFRKQEMSMVGSLAIETIKQFHFDRFYLGLGGFSKTEGPTDYALEEVEIKRALIERSKKVIALVDSSKYGMTSLVKVCDYDDIDELVTNELEGVRLADELELGAKLTLV
ncbi:DeoR family transcriptional regulator [Cohnella xylanilytica]|uniref:DeoR/GlpR transcriptional regulator n=1 Tax=Cohnella xylanilytica TaxID=557555 RepID=A0A841U6F5_9BACL|nr:DeoR/GlpR family DNA-binding transcription regulator [Cohnella xylanilytica]MBB6695409.1 DeoR/GlpR transcriptional regulator [Cohnella xylanilytica]GIO13316.1 DeoR family transcriptional regulator [Cohnella xylanilytica]